MTTRRQIEELKILLLMCEDKALILMDRFQGDILMDTKQAVKAIGHARNAITQVDKMYELEEDAEENSHLEN